MRRGEDTAGPGIVLHMVRKSKEATRVQCTDVFYQKAVPWKALLNPLAGVLVSQVVAWYSGPSHQNELTVISGYLARP
jgi:hypothetical protein